MVILQDSDDDYKATSVPGTPIAQWHLGLDNGAGSNTGNSTGENLEGSMNAAKDDGKSGTPCL